MNLSKSRYTSGIRCEKLLWLDCFHKELAVDIGNNSVLENGNEVGELARGLFGEYSLIDFNKGFSSMIQDTKKLLDEKESIICEASFCYDGNFCSVDILKNDLDGVEIYEVKSSTEIKDIYIDDISYQVWVLKKCGLNVKKACIVYVNSQYIKNGAFDIEKYFKIQDVSNDILEDNVLYNVTKFKEILDNNREPSIDLSISCHTPYDCPYFHYCTRNLPSPNVFDVGCSVRFSSKLEKYYNNIITYRDILDNGGFNDRACEQMLFEINNLPPKINRESIRGFLDKITYPVYFLDFESYQASIPTIDGTKPYQQICFQYSLHYYLEEDGELFHKEFLSDDYDGNPMYGLCERLCQDIPKDSCVLVYNDSFEKTRLLEMANLFSEFRDHLLNIRDNIIDLFPIFKKHDYYVKEMEGSASIKKVLPALFPNDSSLDYHNLEQVHKGDEASSAYLSLKNLEDDERDELRHNMLKYCELDTFAMVKIYSKLKENSEVKK